MGISGLDGGLGTLSKGTANHPKQCIGHKIRRALFF
jgi:hypothetical protein